MSIKYSLSNVYDYALNVIPDLDDLVKSKDRFSIDWSDRYSLAIEIPKYYINDYLIIFRDYDNRIIRNWVIYKKDIYHFIDDLILDLYHQGG